MKGILNSFSNLFNGAANQLRDGVLPPRELEARNTGKSLLEMVKVACGISVVAALFFLSIFPSIFTLVLTGMTGLGAHETYRLADNILEMLNKFTTEVWARASKQNLNQQLGKDTLIAGTILRGLDPDWTEVGITAL
jgi:hypothetical protein